MHVLVRLWQVNIALWGYLAWWGCIHAHLIRPKIAPPLRFTATLEKLGTTFVKLGQGLSLHGEILPDDYIAALQKLQDHVGPFPGHLAKPKSRNRSAVRCRRFFPNSICSRWLPALSHKCTVRY